ncbi:MAG TPA: NUDIX domain-containing protein [Candidatus Limnocylindria bacterium]|nr:NUDIX domain-containing protein [Candidatus Limnocylindria bacterium]
MTPIAHFHHCPRCGQALAAGAKQAASLECGACGFRYYFNAGAAVAAFVRQGDGRWLFIRRAKEPGRGKLAPAGGFVDIGETAEAAIRRELREEIGVTLETVTFLCSQPNSYLYRDVTYPTLDLFFVATLAAGSEPQVLEEVTSFGWFKAQEVAAEDLAFPSMQAAWRQVLAGETA